MTAGNQVTNIFRFRKAKKMVAEMTTNSEDNENLRSFSIIKNDTVSLTDELDKTKTNEKSEITRAMCINELCAMSKDRKNMYLTFAIVAPIFLILMTLAAKMFIILGVACSLLCFTQYIKYKKIYDSINNLNFCIKIDTCIDKKYSYDSEDNSVSNFRIFFENGGKYKINMSHRGIYMQSSSEKSTYNGIDIGEKCYTVCIGVNKKIYYALPVKDFTISASEFKEINNCFYPIKDKSAEEIVIKDESIQRAELLPMQLANVEKAEETTEKAEETTEKALKKRKSYIVFSIITIALTALGIISEIIQVLNIFIQPFLFIIPSIPTIIAVRKAKKAVDNIDYNYAECQKLRNKQNAGALSLLLLGGNVLAYLGNFLLIIFMRI